MGRTGRPGPRSMSGGGHVLVTGGAGFIGSNLVERLASGGEKVLIYDSLARAGVEDNLKRLTERYPDRVSLVVADVRDHQALGEAAAGASAVFHLAAQVAVTTSMVAPEDRKSGVKGKRVSVRVDHGGLRIIKKKNEKKHNTR